MIFIFKSWQLSMTLKISTEIAVDVSVREMKFILNWKIWVSSSNCWPLTDWPCIRSSGWNILISQHENYLVICCWKIFQLAAEHHVTGSYGWCWLSLCYLFHCSYYLTLTDSRMGGNNNVGFLHNSLITLLGFKYFLCHSQSNIFSSQPLTVTLYQLDLTVWTMTDQWFISSQQMTEPNIFQWNIFLLELSHIWLSDCSDVTWCQWCLSDVSVMQDGPQSSAHHWLDTFRVLWAGSTTATLSMQRPDEELGSGQGRASCLTISYLIKYSTISPPSVSYIFAV